MKAVNKEGKTAALCEAAIMTALSVLFLVLARYVPLLGILLIVAAGLPFAVLVVHRGLGVSVTAFAASALVYFILSGDIVGAAVAAAVYLLPGLVVGYAVRSRTGFYTLLAATCGVVLFGLMLELMLLNMAADGHGIAQIIEESMQIFRQTAGDILERTQTLTGVQRDLMPIVNAMADRAQEMIKWYFPSLVLSVAILLSYAIVAFALFTFRRLRVRAVAYVPFWYLKVPKSMCYVTAILFLVVTFSNDTTRATASLSNLVVILYLLIAADGLAVIDFQLRRWVPNGYLRACIYIGVLVVGYMLLSIIANLLIILGMIDGVLNFRRIIQVSGENGENQR